jgi:hypothetical protein
MSVHLNYLGDSTVGVGCLDKGADSTAFRLVIILDSPQPVGGSLFVSLARPYVPAPPARNPNVSASVHLLRSSRVSGTGCNKGGGTIVRASPAVLDRATVVLNPVGALDVEVYASTGRLIHSQQASRPPERHTITWITPKPS